MQTLAQFWKTRWIPQVMWFLRSSNPKQRNADLQVWKMIQRIKELMEMTIMEELKAAQRKVCACVYVEKEKMPLQEKETYMTEARRLWSSQIVKDAVAPKQQVNVCVCDWMPFREAFALCVFVLIRAIKVASASRLIAQTGEQRHFMPLLLPCYRFFKSSIRRTDHCYTVWCFRKSLVSSMMFLGVLFLSFLQLKFGPL